MANRHKFKSGGAAMKGRDDYSGTGEPKVIKEAKSTKNFASGGATEMKAGGKVGKSRIKKARGGGCDQNPFSSAHRG